MSRKLWDKLVGCARWHWHSVRDVRVDLGLTYHLQASSDAERRRRVLLSSGNQGVQKACASKPDR